MGSDPESASSPRGSLPSTYGANPKVWMLAHLSCSEVTPNGSILVIIGIGRGLFPKPYASSNTYSIVQGFLED